VAIVLHSHASVFSAGPFCTSLLGTLSSDRPGSEGFGPGL
jgi:hypothetical protein